MQLTDEELSKRTAAIDILALLAPRELRKTYDELLLIDSAIIASARLGWGVRVWRDAAGFHAHPTKHVTPGIVHDTSAIVSLGRRTAREAV